MCGGPRAAVRHAAARRTAAPSTQRGQEAAEEEKVVEARRSTSGRSSCGGAVEATWAGAAVPSCGYEIGSAGVVHGEEKVVA